MQKLAPSLQRQTSLSSASETSTNRRAIYAAERARLLLGSYRKGDANDPETYVTSIAAVLSSYPEDVIRTATDPRTGVQRKFPKWMPNSGEVAEFCDGLYQVQLSAERRRRDLEAQMAERELVARQSALPRPTYEELVARCRADGLMIGPESKATRMTESEVEAFRAEHGVSAEQWAAIPEAKP